MANLTPELEAERSKIVKIAADYGLDFYETIFEVITYKEMNQIAAYGGFPVRYPHWRFGMEYESLAKRYEYGLGKIYELVINTDPCYAYLLEGNMMVDQKMVMAHVYGHCDFFKNNFWFSKTNRKMMDVMANHSTRIRRYIDRYGIENVENFIDSCLSLENLIDRFGVYSPQSSSAPSVDPDDENQRRSPLLRVDREYMDDFINPPEFVKDQAKKALEIQESSARIPQQPDRDVLGFLLKYAPLTPWQQDILSIIREEAYYFAPQGMTKIMNEGWASFWHVTMMTNKVMSDSELVDFADHHSSTVVMQPNGFNPYKIGIELFFEIEDRWNKGRFGKEWEECDDIETRKNWDTKAGLGREKIFEVRRHYNDVTFISEFLTEDFCVRNKMFVYKYNKRTNQFEVDTRDFEAIKAKLLFQLTNWGQPIIRVIDSNFENRGELLLAHRWEGIDMQPDFMYETLANLYKLWRRPVNLATVMDGERKLFKFTGEEVKDYSLGGDEQKEKTEEKSS